MPVSASLSTYFVGPMGALIMSMISFSIVFIVIIGLMFVMMATNKILAMTNVGKSSEGK